MLIHFSWEEIHARTGDNLAASREILKDAGTVTRWSRQLREKVQQQKQARQEERVARQQGGETRQQANLPDADPLPSDLVETVTGGSAETVTGEFVLVVRLDLDLDLMKSPQLLRLFEGLAAGQGTAGGLRLEHQVLEDRSLVFRGQCPVVVDLREVKTVDGSGLSCLVAGHRLLVAVGLRLVLLLLPASQPARVFDMTNMAKIIPAFGSLDEL